MAATNYSQQVIPSSSAAVNRPFLSGRSPGADDLATWTKFFGPPPVKQQNFGEDIVETHQDMYKIYEGQNLYLADTITGFILSDVAWETSVLPWLETDQMHITFSRFEFKNTLATPVPYEGIPRLIVNSGSTFSDSVHRLGIGFIMEADALSTPEGLNMYNKNLAQISMASMEAVKYATLVALLVCKSYEQERQDLHLPNSRATERVEDKECEYFGILSVNREGFTQMVKDYAATMKSTLNGAEADTLIMFPRFQMFNQLILMGTYTEYWQTGPAGIQFLREGPIAPGRFLDMAVYETREFNAYTNGLRFNPLLRRVTLGEHYLSVFGQWRGERLPRNFSNKWRGLQLYDIVSNDWALVDFLSMFKHANLFGRNQSAPDALHPNVQRLADIHNEQFKDDFNSEAEKYAPENLSRLDNLDGNSFPGRRVFFMLAHNVEKRRVDPVRTFGEFDIDVMNTSDIEQTANSLIDKAFPSEEERDKVRAEITNIDKLVTELENQPYNPTFARAISAFNTEFSVTAQGVFRGVQDGADEPVDWDANEYGGLRLPPQRQSGVTVPVGFASWQGIATLADQPANSDWNQALVKRAKDAVETINMIVNKVDGLVRETKVFDPLNVPKWIHAKSPQAAFFNHVWVTRPAIALAVRGGAVVGTSTKGAPPSREDRLKKERADREASRRGQTVPQEKFTIVWSPIPRDAANPGAKPGAILFPDIFPRLRYLDVLYRSTPASTTASLADELAGGAIAGGATKLDTLLQQLLTNVPYNAAPTAAEKAANDKAAAEAEDARQALLGKLLALIAKADRAEKMPFAVRKLKEWVDSLDVTNAAAATPEFVGTTLTAQVDVVIKNFSKDVKAYLDNLDAAQKKQNDDYGAVLMSVQVGTGVALATDGSTPAGRGGRVVLPMLVEALPDIQAELFQPSTKSKSSKSIIAVQQKLGEELEAVGRKYYPITKTELRFDNWSEWVNAVMAQDSLSEEELNAASEAWGNYSRIAEETERRAAAKYAQISAAKQSSSASMDALGDEDDAASEASFDRAGAFPGGWNATDAQNPEPKVWFRSPLVNSPALMKSLAAQANIPWMLPMDPRTNYRTVYAPWHVEGTAPQESLTLQQFTEVTSDPQLRMMTSTSQMLSAKPFAKTPWIASLLKRDKVPLFYTTQPSAFQFSREGLPIITGVAGNRRTEKFDVNNVRSEARQRAVHFGDSIEEEASAVAAKMKAINRERLMRGQPMREFSRDFSEAAAQVAALERSEAQQRSELEAAEELGASSLRDPHFRFGTGAGAPLAAGAGMMFDPINRAAQFSRQMKSAGAGFKMPRGGPPQTGIWRGDRDNSNVQYDVDRLQREQEYEEAYEGQFLEPRDWQAHDPRFYGDYRDYRFGDRRGPGYAPQGYYAGEFGIDPNNPTFGVHGAYTLDQHFFNRSGVGPGGGRPDRTWPGQYAPSPAVATDEYQAATHPNVEYRYRRAQEHGDVLTRLGMLAVMHLPNTWRAWTTLIKKDIHAPVNLIAWRLNITLEMHTALMLRSGIETGANVVGKAGAAMAGSVADRMVYASYVFHHKTMIFDEKGVIHLRDVQFGGYIAGLDTTFVMTRKELKEDERGSIIVTAIPITENKLPARLNFVDTTVARLLPSQTNREKDIDSVPDYSSARYYQELWGYNESYLNHTRATNRYHTQSQRVNVRSSEGKYYSGGPNNTWKLHKGQGQLAGKKMGPGVKTVLIGTNANILGDDVDPPMRQF